MDLELVEKILPDRVRYLGGFRQADLVLRGVDHELILGLRRFERAFQNVLFDFVVEVPADHGGGVEGMEQIVRVGDAQSDQSGIRAWLRSEHWHFPFANLACSPNF